MHHEDIKAAVRKRGVTPNDLAGHLGVSPSTVSAVIRGKLKSRRVAESVAKLVGQPVSDIWPGLYEAPKGPDVAALLRGGRK